MNLTETTKKEAPGAQLAKALSRTEDPAKRQTLQRSIVALNPDRYMDDPGAASDVKKGFELIKQTQGRPYGG